MNVNDQAMNDDAGGARDQAEGDQGCSKRPRTQERESTAKGAAAAVGAEDAQADASATGATREVASGPTAPPARKVIGAQRKNEAEEDTMRVFREAAARLAAQRAEESLSVEERIVKRLQGWMHEWEEELDRRPADVKASAVEQLATKHWSEAKSDLNPLYESLDQKKVPEELRAPLWKMLEAVRQGQHQEATNLYFSLATSTKPWPMGVKDSSGSPSRGRQQQGPQPAWVRNASSMAQDKNNPVAQKCLQAIKRLMGVVERLHS